MIWLLRFFGPRRLLRLVRTMLVGAVYAAGLAAIVVAAVRLRPLIDKLAGRGGPPASPADTTAHSMG
jgi:hypothetical protein